MLGKGSCGGGGMRLPGARASGMTLDLLLRGKNARRAVHGTG